MGVKFSFQCFCDHTLNLTAMLIEQSNYNYACCADTSVACGGDYATNIYQAIGPTPAQSTNLAIGSGNNSNNTSAKNHADNGNNNNQTSNSIALGIGIGFGIPSVFLAAAVVIRKYLKRRNDRDHGDSRSSSSMAPLTNISALIPVRALKWLAFIINVVNERRE